MKKNLLSWIALAALAAVAVMLWQRHQARAAEVLVFRTATVQRGDVTQTVSASGSLSAVATVEVGSQVSGNIAKINADFNDTVTAGQIVAEIEPSTYQARLVQAESDLANARATLELKQLNAKRAEELVGKQLISQSDADTARAELRQQEATVKNREASYQSAQVDLERCTIKSPIDGVVISRDIDVGQTVQASFSAPKLFTLAKDLREMQITANVSEADIGGVAPGQTVSFTVDAFPGRAFTGQVRQIRNNPTTTSNVVNYSTIIAVNNDDLRLRPGMTATATITIARRAGVLRVPNAALRFKPAAGIAVAAETKTADGKAKAPDAAADDDGPPMPDLDSMPDEIRQRILADFDTDKDGKLSAEERKAMQAQMRSRMGGGGGGPPGGFPSGGNRPARAAAATSQSRTVYLVVGGGAEANGRVAGGSLALMTVTTGVSDSAYTEIVSGLNGGAVLATGTAAADTGAAKSSSNPFMPSPPGARR